MKKLLFTIAIMMVGSLAIFAQKNEPKPTPKPPVIVVPPRPTPTPKPEKPSSVAIEIIFSGDQKETA